MKSELSGGGLVPTTIGIERGGMNTPDQRANSGMDEVSRNESFCFTFVGTKVKKHFRHKKKKEDSYCLGILSTLSEKISPGSVKLFAVAISVHLYPSPYALTAIFHKSSPAFMVYVLPVIF